VKILYETRKNNSGTLNPLRHIKCLCPPLTTPSTPSVSTPTNHLSHCIMRPSNVLMHYSNHSPTISLFSFLYCVCMGSDNREKENYVQQSRCILFSDLIYCSLVSCCTTIYKVVLHWYRGL